MMSTPNDSYRTNQITPAVVLLEMIRSSKITQLIYAAAKLGIADLLEDRPKYSNGTRPKDKEPRTKVIGGVR